MVHFVVEKTGYNLLLDFQSTGINAFFLSVEKNNFFNVGSQISVFPTTEFGRAKNKKTIFYSDSQEYYHLSRR